MMRQLEFMGFPMNAGTVDETIALIASRVQAKTFTQHVVVNVAKIVHIRRDRALADSVQACDVINIEGMGVVWAHACSHTTYPSGLRESTCSAVCSRSRRTGGGQSTCSARPTQW